MGRLSRHLGKRNMLLQDLAEACAAAAFDALRASLSSRPGECPVRRPKEARRAGDSSPAAGSGTFSCGLELFQTTYRDHVLGRLLGN